MQIRIGNKIYKNKDNFNYYDDLVELQKMMEDLGFPKINLDEISDMWETISEKYCASWLCVPKTKEDLIDYLEIIEIS